MGIFARDVNFVCLRKMSVVGDYEYVKPGSMTKSTQKLSLKADHSVTYSEEGKTGMEEFTATGTGTWSIEGAVCRVVLAHLKKEMRFKVKTLVPGIEDGSVDKHNVVIPINVSELENAPKH